MNRIAKLATAAAFAALSAGCIVVTDDGWIQPGDPLDAELTLTWTTELAESGRVVDCRSVGAESTRVISENLDTGEVFADRFDCAIQRGTTGPLSAGDYAVTVQLADCRGLTGCPRPDVYAGVDVPGVLEIWHDQTIDLGHVVFSVH